MCGIAGFFEPAGRAAGFGRGEALKAMTDAIRHRGPDADGQWISDDGACGLGHRRLSIIDLSAAGAQPMVSHSGRYIIAFNGEIYNFQDLRREVEQRRGAVPWRGHSDTEVLLELIADEGVGPALAKTDGMFAIAVYDREARTLTLARDAFGEKPLVYGLWKGGLLFASEITALEAWPGFGPDENAAARSAVVRHGYIPAPATIYSGIFKLPPAHLVTMTGNDVVQGSLPAPECWWDMPGAALSARTAPFEGSLDDAVDAVDDVLRRSVGARMVSDVPLGALLSGGIDSSLTTALMQTVSDRPVRTFTIGMAEEGYDESPFAEAVARHLGTDHETFMLTPEEVQATIPDLPRFYDEPFADSSQVPTYLVSRMARKHVTVVLSGDGGDELFAGYNRHFVAPQLWSRLSPVPSALRRLGAGALNAVPPQMLTRAVGMAGPLAPKSLSAGRAGEKLHKLAWLAAARDRETFHRRLLETDGSHILADDGDARVAELAHCDPRGAHLPFGEMAMLSDTGFYLHNDVLTKVDRATMAVSLEARTPYLNRELFALAWRLPQAAKADGSTGKIVLRRLLDRYVPRDLVDRPKAGFAMPIGRWLRGPLADWAESLLSERALADTGVFDTRRVRRLWQQHRSGARDYESLLWSVLMYQGWRQARRGAG